MPSIVEVWVMFSGISVSDTVYSNNHNFDIVKMVNCIWLKEPSGWWTMHINLIHTDTAHNAGSQKLQLHKIKWSHGKREPLSFN